ncbi:MAG: hypothetical protein WDO19_20760 [Bacteroidota bacterium]
MYTDTNLQFIREKINTLKTAVMYANTANAVNIGNDIVTALKIDDEGQLWLLANRPALHTTDDILHNFHARLHFFKKGADFFIEVSGKASIVSRCSLYLNYKIFDTNLMSKYQNKIVIKLALTVIEYTEPGTKKIKSKIEIAALKWYSWFLRMVSVHHDNRSALEKLAQIH